ncbi:MAG TPA: OB-fold nucleic acid binding domain-containing protein, partial [Dermatophilaceae bacterium]|nr:OB-fold nucleic acid binding domain-containing protein [Dermatophilaceae bacterium]
TPEVQQQLDFSTGAVDVPASGLPEMTDVERVTAELGILGIDVSSHVVSRHKRLFAALGVTPAADLLSVRNSREVLVGGVKVATQTPAVRSGRRVIFLTLDDTTGLSDATFFEDVQGPYAAVVFHSWLLLVRGVLRRTGPRGVSVRATGAWELSDLWRAWLADGLTGAESALAAADAQAHALAAAGHSYDERARAGAAVSRSPRPVMASPTPSPTSSPILGVGSGDPTYVAVDRAGGMGGGGHRVLVHPSGFRQSPYADVRPPGEDTRAGRGLADAVTLDTRSHHCDDLLPQGSQVFPDPSPPPANLDAPAHLGDEGAGGPGRQDPAGAVQSGQAPRKLWHASPGSAGH